MVRGGGGGGATFDVGDVSKLMSFISGEELPKFKVSLSPPWIEKKRAKNSHTKQTKTQSPYSKYVLGLLTTETNVALDMSGTSLGGGDSP